MKLGELMSREVVTVGPDTPLKEVAGILAEHRISGVPVLSDTGVVGVISQSDVIARETGAANPAGHGRRRLSLRRKARAETGPARVASDAMTSPAITMEAYRTVSAAAKVMLEHRIHRIPIVRRGALVGIVSAGDLVRAFARPDDQIAAEVRKELRYRLDVVGDNREVDVELVDSCVTLRGTVAFRSTAESLVEAAAAVPGVLDVRSEVRWVTDDSKLDRTQRSYAYL